MKTIVRITFCLLATPLALAATPPIDGANIPTDFGAAVSTQDTNTRFGNNENELNQLFVTSDSGNLYLGMTGNLADNNALSIFIDTDVAVNVPGETIGGDPNTPCPGDVPTILRMWDGSHMEAGMDPDYIMVVSVGKFPGQSDTQLVYSVDLTRLSDLSNIVAGIGLVGSGSGALSGASGMKVAINNSNVDGVGGWFSPGGETPAQTGDDPTDAVTGIEIAIPKASLGVGAGATIRVFAYVSNNAQGCCNGPCFREAYGSNQAMPGLAGADNLATFYPGGPMLNFATLAGTQYVQVVVP